MSRWSSILLWSVLAAAFIGPGTVTTAASAGASFGFALLWALLFSTLACVVLQEASARLTIVSGQSLGRVLRLRYPGTWLGTAMLLLLFGAIVVGCAAYEAGNILGGVAIALGAGLGLSDALRTYTILTIGDGLVSQIPALLISVAAGLVVTRSSGDLNLGQALTLQIFGQRKALDIAGVALGVDRLLLALVGAARLDQVMAFPSNRA